VITETLPKNRLGLLEIKEYVSKIIEFPESSMWDAVIVGTNSSSFGPPHLPNVTGCNV
jgi:hypothetical protein